MQNLVFSPLKFVVKTAFRKGIDVNSALLNQCYYIIYNRTKIYINSFVSRLQYQKLLYYKAASSLISGSLMYHYFEENFLSVKAATKSYKELLTSADRLYDQQKFDELYELLIPEKESNNDEVLWRLARAIYERSRRIDNAEKKKTLFYEALSYVESANDINNNNFAVHKWLTILKDNIYTLEGIKSKISHMFELKYHMEKACHLKPDDGTSWYILGMWYFGVANVSWYERKVANLLFGTLPEATYQEALDKFMKAESVEPNFYSKNYLMIGKCLYYLGRRDEAKTYFLKAKSYDGNTLDDQEAKKEAEKWL